MVKKKKITKWGSYKYNNEFISHSENEVWKFPHHHHFPFVSFRLYKQCLGKWTLKKDKEISLVNNTGIYPFHIFWTPNENFLGRESPRNNFDTLFKIMDIYQNWWILQKLWLVRIQQIKLTMTLFKKKKKISLHSNIRIKFR